MRSTARLLPAVLACTVALAACGTQPSGDAAAGSDSTSTGTTPEPGSTEQATGIPDDFPLAAGMGGPGDTIPTTRTGTGLRDLDVCGTSPLRGLGTRDRMVADNSGGEALHTRELVLLGSPDEGLLVAQAFTDLATDCDPATTSDAVVTTTEVRESPFGEAPAAVLVQGFDFAGEPGRGRIVVHVVPVGPALLVTQKYGEWPDVTEGITQGVEPLEGVVEAMAAFGEPTETPTETPTESATAAAYDIPDDFPLLAGWPPSSEAEGEGGRRGPTRTDEPLEFPACDEAWRETPYVDRLRSNWVSAEDYRYRQLTTYADDATAAAALADLVAHEQSCPTEPPDKDGFGVEREVRPVTLGDEAWAILERDTFHGSPSIFGDSNVVVRIGRAVLVVRHGGHAGFPAGDGQFQIDAIRAQAAKALSAMCQFTRTGCT